MILHKRNYFFVNASLRLRMSSLEKPEMAMIVSMGISFAKNFILKTKELQQKEFTKRLQ